MALLSYGPFRCHGEFAGCVRRAQAAFSDNYLISGGKNFIVVQNSEYLISVNLAVMCFPSTLSR